MLYKAGKYKHSLFNPKNVSYCHTIEPIYKIESPKKISPQKLPIRRIGTKKCETVQVANDEGKLRVCVRAF